MDRFAWHLQFGGARAWVVAVALIPAISFGWLPALAQQQDPANQPAAVIDQPGGEGQPAAQGEQRGTAARQPADTNANEQPAESSESQLRYVPRTLMINRGTIITARTSQFISSNQNKPGDIFTAELQQPVVVNGWVIARRGQTILGRVVVARKAGRIKGTSELGLELNRMILVDGQQVGIRSQLMQISGDTSKGRDAQAIGTTTGMGAAIGGVANGGEGAGIGAAIGAGAGLAGILLTRGHPTVVPPESTLTFEVQTPIAVSTTNSGPAFRPVAPGDYSPSDNGRLQRRPRLARSPYGPPLPYYYSYFGPWGYPGPFFVGYSYFGGGFGHRRGRH
jgi:hypothetical protein